MTATNDEGTPTHTSTSENQAVSGEVISRMAINAITSFQRANDCRPLLMKLSQPDAQAVIDYAWERMPAEVRPAKRKVPKIGDMAQLRGVPLAVADIPQGTMDLDGLTFYLSPSIPSVVAGPPSTMTKYGQFYGNPPTSNVTSHELAAMLLAHPDAPVLVLFDNQAGVASELFVLTQISDGPDWADPSTVYIDAHGG